jgi:hypothetical protein
MSCIEPGTLGLLADGNPLALVDSDMPELFGHLGLWQSGAPLPILKCTAAECAHPVLQKGGLATLKSRLSRTPSMTMTH